MQTGLASLPLKLSYKSLVDIHNEALAGRSKVVPVALLTTLTLVWAVPAFATGDITAMQVMANSYEMQGTTDFYYKNEWLVKFVQFAISWLCIISLLVFYAGWLCSLVVLSNKELFYLIDTIKKEASDAGGGEQKGWSAMNSVLHSLKNGSSNGVNGGLDNIVLFILSLSINVKAYSYYKDIEAGSDGEDGSGFSYNDTVLKFLLKTAIPAISITFVTSVAISGVLLQCWFTISDVFAVRAERFAQTNLSAKVDELLGADQQYEFTLGSSGLHGGMMADEMASKAYSYTVAQFPNASQAELQAIGKATENIYYEKILGSQSRDYYSHLQGLVEKSVDNATKNDVKITNEAQAKLVSYQFVPNGNEKPAVTGAVTVSMEQILNQAGVSPDEVNKSMREYYFHYIFDWDKARAATMVNTKPGKE